MNKYIVTGWSFTEVLIHDVAIDGVDVVLGTYSGENEDSAKAQATEEHGIDKNVLTAHQLSS